jgi:hypothetical protein
VLGRSEAGEDLTVEVRTEETLQRVVLGKDRRRTSEGRQADIARAERPAMHQVSLEAGDEGHIALIPANDGAAARHSRPGLSSLLGRTSDLDFAGGDEL